MQWFKYLAVFGGTALLINPAHAWDANSHQRIGALADRLLTNTRAASEVEALLGGIKLQEAAVWADCVKSVDPGQDYTYQDAGKYPECKIFETTDGVAEMRDFVRRNDNNCERKPAEESCHKQYHYTDIAIQRGRYDARSQGARADDLVAAIMAAIQVLKGETALSPFAYKNKREALLVLAHYMGDLHQPLHVGAVYLSALGKPVDPELTVIDPETDTRGGNAILLTQTGTMTSKNLHSAWDAAPPAWDQSMLDAGLLMRVGTVEALSDGAILNWPVVWASETVLMARQQAFKGLKFSQKQDKHWQVSLSKAYIAKMNKLKLGQLAKSGKRLADVLNVIWP